MKSIKIILAQLLLWVSAIYGQNLQSFKDSIEIGKPIPDYVFEDIHYFNKTKASVKDFRGKWLILDYWHKNCGGCIASFPKMSDLQRKFRDRVQILMVGNYFKKENYLSTKTKYEQVKREKKVELAVAYDIASAKKYNVNYYPDILIVDPEGIVRGRQSIINEEDLEKYLSGQFVKVIMTSNQIVTERSKFRRDVPLLINGNGGSDTSYLFRSLLMKYHPGIPTDPVDKNGRFELRAATLEHLYKLAYLGWKPFVEDFSKYHPKLILEIADSSLFKPNFKYQEGLYAYSLSYPKKPGIEHIHVSQNKYVRNIMKNDLANYFLFDAFIEKRKVINYQLTITEAGKNKLRKYGMISIDKRLPEELRKSITKGSIDNIMMILEGGANGTPYEPAYNVILKDATGIDFKFDYAVQATYFDQYIEIFSKYGLKIEPIEEEMECLVIRDRKPEKLVQAN